jgi:single-strand DNA-binding protein
MLNRVVLVGRLTKDPELKYTPNGVAVCNFTLAVNRPFKNGQGEQEADFINIVVWRKPAENAAQYLKKGSLAGVDGRLQTRSYENQQGQRVYVIEVMAESVQFLEPKGNRNDSPRNAEEQQFGQQQNNSHQYNQNQNSGGSGNPSRNNFNDDPFANDGTPIDISDDDLPY